MGPRTSFFARGGEKNAHMLLPVPAMRPISWRRIGPSHDTPPPSMLATVSFSTATRVGRIPLRPNASVRSAPTSSPSTPGTFTPLVHRIRRASRLSSTVDGYEKQ